MSIITHLETHLGKIHRGWGDKLSRTGVQVVEFRNQPFEGVTTYATLGLSDLALTMGAGRTVRQELIFSAYDRFKGEHIASFLSTFADHLISRRKAPLRGDVVGPSTPIILGTVLNSVYSAIPVVFDENFAVYDETNPPTVLVWVIPIHEEEANLVRAAGWPQFENLMEKTDPDLWDLHRPSIV